MTQQEIRAVEEAAEAQANKLRLYTSKYDFSRGFIVGAQFLDELRKPSEPETNVGEAGKELVERIIQIIKTAGGKYYFANALCSDGFELVATEIAALMQPDKELLGALKETDKDLCVLESTMLQIEQRDHLAEGMAELVKKWRARNKQAISNYEKTDQMTYSDYVRKDLALEFATRFYEMDDVPQGDSVPTNELPY